MRKHTALAVVLALITSTASAADWFASPQGDDAKGTGAKEKPFRTILKGLERARAGDRVVLRAGEYRMRKRLQFPRAGEPGRAITLTAHADEYVALLGSVRLTGWERHEGKLWKAKSPSTFHHGITRGLYQDGERLTHPRPDWGKRKNPPVSELKTPGTWTQVDGWVYVRTREDDSPALHRIEASQHGVVVLNRDWLRIEKLHMFFGENTVCVIHGDHCEVVNCEIAHCSNSGGNAYCAYFSGCSNSAFRDCVIHDSFYWGWHGANSHVVSCINCGDRGPNFVDRCEIFNGGLGVGTKGGAREIVVTDCLIYDVINGITISGERSRGPGTGKKDRGYYVVYRNRIRGCGKGVWFFSGRTRNNRVWNNLFERCGTGVSMRSYRGEPKESQIADNVFTGCEEAVYVVGGRNGVEPLPKFFQAGLSSHNNLYYGNTVDWRTPTSWTARLDMTLAQVQAYKGLGLEKNSIAKPPLLDELGRAKANSPTIGSGSALPLPKYIETPKRWDIGLGPRREGEKTPKGGLTLRIAGSTTTAGAGEKLVLRALLTNESAEPVEIAPERDAVVTYHFRYLGGHYDKQELYRCRVELPEGKLEPGKSLDLTKLRGWKDPVNGKLGDAFHLRTDTKEWQRGCRMRATARFVGRTEETANALQRLDSLLRSKEVLKVSFRQVTQKKA